MDAADVSPSDGVMIAFLPTAADWSKTNIPHMTLVYAGSKADLSPTDFNNICKDASSLALLASPFYLVAKGVQQLGPPDDRVSVLALQPTPDLWAMRKFVEKWNKSEFPFSPHISIGPATDFIDGGTPRSVGFDRLYVGYGDENVTFNLRRGNSY